MPSKRTPEPTTLTLDTKHFYNRLAWYEWQLMQPQANVLRDLANWFEPPLRIDEARVKKRVAELEASRQKNQDPAGWG